MGEWKQSKTIKLPFPVEASFLLPMPDRTIQGLFRNGEVLEHWTRGSRDPFPWQYQATIPGKYKGSGNILLFTDGNYLIGWPKVTPEGAEGEVLTFWSRPSKWPDPSHPTPPPPPPPPPPPIKKKLSVAGDKFYYGDDEIKLCGVSRLEALWRMTNEHGWHGWGDEYSQDEYEKDLIDSGINYVRHLGIMDFDILYAHCERMRETGIIVEIGVYRVAEAEGVLVELDRMGELAELGNVFFDVCNEFIGGDESEVATVINIAENLRAQGCLVSAGAWSGNDGKALSDLFYSQYNDHDIASHHRDWEEDSFKETLARGKPVCFSEYFSQGNLSLGETKDIMDEAFGLGIATQYYGFRWPGIPGLSRYDPFPYMSIVNYAGNK